MTIGHLAALRPELHVALQRLDRCCRGDKAWIIGVQEQLLAAIQAADDATKHAFTAWDELQPLSSDINSIFQLVDLVDRAALA